MAVVGGGNSALQEALYLSNICNKVYIIHRKDNYRVGGQIVDNIDSKDNIVQLLGKNVKKLRKLNNMKQQELAEMIGFDVKSLSLIENGTGFASAKNIDKLAESLNVPISDLFDDVSDIEPEKAYNNLLRNLEFIKDNTSKLNTVNLVVKSLL